MSSTKTIQLCVPEDYELDSWFTDAKPDETALVLDLASRFPRIVGDEQNDMAAKLYAARTDGTNEAIKKVLTEARHQADATVKQELEALKSKSEHLRTQRDQLMETNAKHEKALLIAEEAIKSAERQHSTELKNMELAFK